MTGERRAGNEAGVPETEKIGVLRNAEQFLTAVETYIGKGYKAVVERLDQLAAFKAGLSTPRVWDTTATTRLIYDPANETVRWVDVSADRNKSQLISDEALFQLFSNPEVQPDKNKYGYAASTEEDNFNKEGRRVADERRRVTEAEAALVVAKHGGEISDYVGRIWEGSEADLIFEEIREREAKNKARDALHDAYDQYIAAGGDEGTAADQAIAFKPRPLQMVDIHNLCKEKEGKHHHNDALLHFIAAGKTGKQLIDEGHEDLAIEGIHYEKGKIAEMARYKYNNPYANDEGWTPESFNNLIKPILKKTDGDLLSVYESWLMFLSFGCASKLGISLKDSGKVDFAGANISSAILKEVYHFMYVLRGEAGYHWNGKTRLNRAAYRGKTGPQATSTLYPLLTEAPYNVGTFLENAKFKLKDENGKTLKNADEEDVKLSLMDALWSREAAVKYNNGKNWVMGEDMPLFDMDDKELTEQGNTGGGGTDVLATGAYGGWWLKIRNIHLVLEAAVNLPKGGVKELATNTYWDKLARNADKGLGQAWKIWPTGEDKNSVDSRKRLMAEAKRNWGNVAPTIADEADSITGEKFKSIQMYPNEKDVRFLIIKGLMYKYLPGSILETGGAFDTSAVPDERFTPVTARATDAANKNSDTPGVPMELFLAGVLDSGFLTKFQIKELLNQVPMPKGSLAFLKQSDRLKHTLFN